VSHISHKWKKILQKKLFSLDALHLNGYIAAKLEFTGLPVPWCMRAFYLYLLIESRLLHG